MPHDPRRFVDAVDFATSPGSGRDIKKIRDQLNLPEGPSILITDKAKFIMSDEGWLLHSILDSFTFEQATEGLPWSLKPPISGPIETDATIISALAQINY